MSEPNAYLDAFASWLKTLASDVNDLVPLLRADTLTEMQRRYIAGSINYLFKSLDLIPDGIEDVGYLDDAFVLRVAARLASAEGPAQGALTRLGGEARHVSDFLGADHARLEAYVKGLTKGAARGRTVDEILGDPLVCEAFLSDVSSWIAGYETPTFTRDDRTLTKLRSFLDSKLPRS